MSAVKRELDNQFEYGEEIEDREDRDVDEENAGSDSD